MLEESPLDLEYVERWLLPLRGRRIGPKLRRLSALSEAVADVHPSRESD
jgi:hypothetical protein